MTNEAREKMKNVSAKGALVLAAALSGYGAHALKASASPDLAIEELSCHRKAGCTATINVLVEGKVTEQRQVIFGQYDINGKESVRGVRMADLPASLRTFVEDMRSGKYNGIAK